MQDNGMRYVLALVLWFLAYSAMTGSIYLKRWQRWPNEIPLTYLMGMASLGAVLPTVWTLIHMPSAGSATLIIIIFLISGWLQYAIIAQRREKDKWLKSGIIVLGETASLTVFNLLCWIITPAVATSALGY